MVIKVCEEMGGPQCIIDRTFSMEFALSSVNH
jgi:hypothetical protein